MVLSRCRAESTTGGMTMTRNNINTFFYTIYASSDDELFASLKNANEMFAKYPCEYSINLIDRISCELVRRGYTWEQIGEN